MKEKIAKVVRVLSVPPVMALTLILIVYFTKPGVFANVAELLVTVFFLSVVPVLAYPFSYLVPSLKNRGREGQRSFAFLLTAVSYPLLVLYTVIAGTGDDFSLIAYTYLLSLVVLLLMNKGIGLKASGHACSVTGPIVLICYFIGMKGILFGLALYALIFWASLVTKGHTAKELIWGALASILAFLFSLLWFTVF
jgi:hypothetical protein